MKHRHRTPPLGGAYTRRWTRYEGLFFDDFATDSAWIRESGRITLPPVDGLPELVIHGEVRSHPAATGLERGALTLRAHTSDGATQTLRLAPSNAVQPFSISLPLNPAAGREGRQLRLDLGGVTLTNTLAWLGRVTGFSAWQRFRAQNKNRQVRILRIEAGGEVIYDFGNRHAPYSPDFARRHAKLGLNITGFLTADLGVGESARCMVRAADAAGLPSALISLKLHCKNRLGDLTLADRLSETNPHAVNVVHLDPPASRDLDHHHGKGFRAGKYNIGYWAWELPEFPDAWASYCDYFDEIWCPSDFVREAIGMTSPVPVLTMPHAIAFTRPTETTAALRDRFDLPRDRFLFLFLYDLNSYAERKNPRAVIDAFRRSGLAARGAALVIKTHSVKGNESDLGRLLEATADLPDTKIIADTFTREDIYRLEAACDCFVSLHRSEGFGLAVAEAMYLGKPVIATDWSATAEFLDETNGCPVRAPLVTLDRNHGPYAKGQTWADPDPAHAAEWMVRVFADSAFRTRIGTAARETIEQRFSPLRIGQRYRRRLETIAMG